MGKRFNDINRAGELKFAFDNLTKYKTDLTTRKSSRITGTGTPKNIVSKLVSIRPFSEGTKVPVLYLVRRTVSVSTGGTVKPSTTLGKTTIDNYYDDTPAATAADAPKGFRAARANVFEPDTAAGSKYVKSKFTGLYYPKTEGKTAAYPFGRSVAAPDSLDEADAKRTIKTAVVTDTGWKDGARISFSDERARSV